jgi:phage terminase large subunit-like protein
MNDASSLFRVPTRAQLEVLKKAHPRKYEETIHTLSFVERQEERLFYEGSLTEFFRRAWREIGEPSPFSKNWHHEVIAAHLEAITRGELRHLIINIPPRHGKTILANIMWPAWIWAQSQIGPLSGPHVRFLSVSYQAELAQYIGSRMRLLVMGEWYQRLWGERVRIRDDQQSRAHFANLAGGERISNSLAGGLLGRGGDIQIIDDPHSTQGAESDLDRHSTLRAFSEGLTTRITDPRIAAKVLVMQRLHEQDCTDWALDNWPRDKVLLMFPARYESNRSVPQDIRTYDGELLWPEVWTDDELRKIELGLVGLEKGQEGLSAYAVAGQMQQNPHARGGAIIDRMDWMVYPEEVPRLEDMRRTPTGETVVPLPDVSYVILVVDTAMSEKETADWNACIVWGVWHRRRKVIARANQHGERWAGRRDVEQELERIYEEDDQPRVMMMEAWRRRCKLNDSTLGVDGKPQGLVQRIVETARRRQADKIVIENKTRGKDLIDELYHELRDEEFRIEKFEPNLHGDKVNRLHRVQPLFAQGLVYAPANCMVRIDPSDRRQYVDIQEFQWVELVRSEVARVPHSRHDDLADCVSSGLIWLRENHFLPLTQEFIKESLAGRTLGRPEARLVAEHYGA